MPLLVYAAAWLVIALLARDPRVSVEHLWPLLVRILGFYLLVDIMRRGRQRWVMEALFLVGGAVVVLSAVELAAWYFGLPLVPGFVQGWPQVFWVDPPAGDPQAFACAHRLDLGRQLHSGVDPTGGGVGDDRARARPPHHALASGGRAARGAGPQRVARRAGRAGAGGGRAGPVLAAAGGCARAVPGGAAPPA
ncbi:MAG: hypothetical protein M5R40_02290 [Anaerolineae bacterium]|nr:hypothetical protein [Anaerolineae bacterium]